MSSVPPKKLLMPVLCLWPPFMYLLASVRLRYYMLLLNLHLLYVNTHGGGIGLECFINVSVSSV